MGTAGQLPWLTKPSGAASGAAGKGGNGGHGTPRQGHGGDSTGLGRRTEGKRKKRGALDRASDQVKAASFRHINQVLYTSTGRQAIAMMKEAPDMFETVRSHLSCREGYIWCDPGHLTDRRGGTQYMWGALCVNDSCV